MYHRMKMFSHNRYLYIKMLYKRMVLQNNSNTLQAIITERTIQKRRNGEKENNGVQSTVFNECENQYR